jgi:hypothetical protein
MWKIWDPAEARNIGENPFFRKDCFIIDASRSQSDIVKDFTSWLNEWHAGGHPGRRIAVGWLQKLSAYRLAKVGFLKHEEAIALITRRKDQEPGASIEDALPTTPQSQRAWLRAIRTVKDQLGSHFITNIRWDFGQLTLKHPPD